MPDALFLRGLLVGFAIAARRTMDGATTTIEGTVPLTHQMVVDGMEYRFSAVSADPRFVEMTAQICDLPQFDADVPEDGAGEAAPPPDGTWVD